MGVSLQDMELVVAMVFPFKRYGIGLAMVTGPFKLYGYMELVSVWGSPSKIYGIGLVMVFPFKIFGIDLA